MLRAILFDFNGVLVDDEPLHLEAAAACGLATLGVAQTYPAEKLAGADRVVDAIDGLSLERLQSLFI